jgi:hypothetical protein
MKTEDLIETLATDLKPIQPGALRKLVFRAAAIGTVMTFVVVVLAFGWREDIMTAVARADFWRKLLFTLAVALLGLATVVRVSRPGTEVTWRALWLIAPFALIVALSVMELVPLQPSERRATWLGETAMLCPVSILLLSVPVLIPLLIGMRRFAPTRPAVAGLVAGLTSGGLAATMYGLHCPEWAASFVATWYSLGIIASGVLGAMIGRRFLRW